MPPVLRGSVHEANIRIRECPTLDSPWDGNEPVNPMATNIAFFMPSLGSGGAERCMQTIARGLAEHGSRVTFVVSSVTGQPAREVSKSLNLVDLESRSIWKSIPKLARYLHHEPPDILVSALDHANVTALLARRLSGEGFPIIVTTHTMVSVAVHSKARLTSEALLVAMRALYPTAEGVVAVSNEVARDVSAITRLAIRSIHVIPVPLLTGEIARLSQSPPPSPLFQPGNPPVVISVGSLYAHKDHRTLIEAVAIARRTRPIRLIILGEGPERARLEALIKDLDLEMSVSMPGFVANPYAWIARSATLVLPSKWEGLPTVLLEAMACGVSPIAADCPGGVAELLGEGRYGMLTPVGDPSAMAAAIVGILERPIAPSELKHRAMQFASENIVERYQKLIVETISHNH